MTKKASSLSYGEWEPFYIGTNAEPLWDEKFDWNGSHNKKIQVSYKNLKTLNNYIYF